MKGNRDAFVLRVLADVAGGKLKKRKAAERLGISRQHLTRLAKRYGAEGPAFLVHGNKGRPNPRKTDPATAKTVVDLYNKKYLGFNIRHFREKLAEEEGILVSYRFAHSALAAAGIRSPLKHKKGKGKKDHPTRKRRLLLGELIQIDASWHNWFGDDLPKATLHGGVDDATGTVMGLYFDEYETLNGYREMLLDILRRYGVPECFYSDNRTIFEYRKADGSEKDVTRIQFGIWCSELGIDVMTTSVPQAKGRIERLWKTMQSRLVSELRLNGITTIDAANEFLPRFMDDYNSRFAAPADGSKFVEGPTEEGANVILSVRYERKADPGGCFSFGGRRLMLVGADGRMVPADPGTILTVMRLRDGTIMCRYRKTVFPTKEVGKMPERMPGEPDDGPRKDERPKPKNNWRSFTIIKPDEPD